MPVSHIVVFPMGMKKERIFQKWIMYQMGGYVYIYQDHRQPLFPPLRLKLPKDLGQVLG